MYNNKSAFISSEYDRKIKQTLPYYDEFYNQVVELVSVFHDSAISWLDVGCGTGKMWSAAFEKIELKRFVFCDLSDEMIRICKKSFSFPNTEFSVCDVKNMEYSDEFDVITAIQVNHYLRIDEREIALKRCHDALKPNGLFISFENFSPFTDVGRSAYLEKWKRFQLKQGKSFEESDKHIERYGKDYFPITLEEHLKLMRYCGFRAVEILWLSNMQVGFWGVK